MDNLKKKLNEMLNEPTKEEDTNISYKELFSDSFMIANTNEMCLEDFLLEAGYVIKSQADFDTLPSETLDHYVSSHTNFKSWEHMKEEALEYYIFTNNLYLF